MRGDAGVGTETSDTSTGWGDPAGTGTGRPGNTVYVAGDRGTTGIGVARTDGTGK